MAVNTSEAILIGCDPSSRKIALVVTPAGEEHLQVRAFDLPQNVIPALALAYRITRRFVRRYAVKGHQVHLCIEEPVVGKGGAYATIKQSKVHGAIVAGAVAAGATVTTVQNSTWKKTVTGKGNNSKVQVAQWVRKDWKALSALVGPDQDLIDAGCIMAHARMEYEQNRKG